MKINIISALITTHRNLAFIRGLTPALSRMVIIQRQWTLPEAYSACLELQNLTTRNNILHSGAHRKFQSTVRQRQISLHQLDHLDHIIITINTRITASPITGNPEIIVMTTIRIIGQCHILRNTDQTRAYRSGQFHTI